MRGVPAAQALAKSSAATRAKSQALTDQDFGIEEDPSSSQSEKTSLLGEDISVHAQPNDTEKGAEVNQVMPQQATSVSMSVCQPLTVHPKASLFPTVGILRLFLLFAWHPASSCRLTLQTAPKSLESSQPLENFQRQMNLLHMSCITPSSMDEQIRYFSSCDQAKDQAKHHICRSPLTGSCSLT